MTTETAPYVFSGQFKIGHWDSVRLRITGPDGECVLLSAPYEPSNEKSIAQVKFMQRVVKLLNEHEAQK